MVPSKRTPFRPSTLRWINSTMPSPIGRLGLRILRSIEVGPPRFEHAPFVSIGKLAAAAGTDGIRKGAALSYRKPHPPRPMQAAQPPARRLRLWFQPAARADVRKAEDKCCTTCRNKRQRRHDYHDTRPSARSLARQHPRVEPAQILWGCGEDIASIGADVNRWRAPHADDIPRLSGAPTILFISFSRIIAVLGLQDSVWVAHPRLSRVSRCRFARGF
jgi:hypothetical protein